MVKGRKKAPGVIVWLVPGSRRVLGQIRSAGLDRIFAEAGFELREPGCSACLAMNDDKVAPGRLCVSTSNRNFEGRQGARFPNDTCRRACSRRRRPSPDISQTHVRF